jgi:hypothetical protein
MADWYCEYCSKGTWLEGRVQTSDDDGGRALLNSALCALVVVLSLLILPSSAEAAAPPFVWSGEEAAGSSSWSSLSNWIGGVGPSFSEPVTLEFPQLMRKECTSTPPSDTCYESDNDIGDLDVESLRIDDGDEYELKGSEITLGASGITAAPAAGTSGAAGDVIGLPIVLDASQAWSVAGRSGEPTGENGVALTGGITGSRQALTVDLSNSPLFGLEGTTEVGPLSIDGSQPGLAGGLVLWVGKLNAANDGSVSLHDIAFEGAGTVGALHASATSVTPIGQIETASAAFDSASSLVLQIVGEGMNAGTDYSQLTSHGAIELGGSSLSILTPTSTKDPCPTVPLGNIYTLVSTTGTLSGSFGNAPEHKDIPIEYPTGCTKLPRYLEVEYHESGTPQTVTAKVVEFNPYVREEDPIEYGRISAERVVAEYWATRHAQEAKEREAREAADRENAERQARAAQQAATSMLALPLASDIAVQRDGAALVGLGCSGSATGQSCAGKLALSVQAKPKGGKRSRTVTITIATGEFSIPSGKTATVHVDLNKVGRALLHGDHGRLDAHLVVLQSAPIAHVQNHGVRLRLA